MRVIGANLVAFNDVTKKATATIDLKKAIAVEDDQDARMNPRSPASASRYADEYDGLYGVERSFRLIFPDSEEIVFFADADEEKAKWWVTCFPICVSIANFVVSINQAGGLTRSCWSYPSSPPLGRTSVAASGGTG